MNGPWSDLPPPEPPRREPIFSGRRGKPQRRGGREPFINNWRGLLIIAFLLFVAPILVRWAVEVLRGMTAGGG